jgi:hypothetical protein
MLCSHFSFIILNRASDTGSYYIEKKMDKMRFKEKVINLSNFLE